MNYDIERPIGLRDLSTYIMDVYGVSVSPKTTWKWVVKGVNPRRPVRLEAIRIGCRIFVRPSALEVFFRETHEAMLDGLAKPDAKYPTAYSGKYAPVAETR